MTLTPAPSYAKVPPGGNDVGRPPIRRPLGSLLRDDVSDQGARQRAAPPGGTSGGGGYTREEIQVLRCVWTCDRYYLFPQCNIFNICLLEHNLYTKSLHL